MGEQVVDADAIYSPMLPAWWRVAGLMTTAIKGERSFVLLGSTREAGWDGVSSRPLRHELCWDITLKKRFRLIKRMCVVSGSSFGSVTHTFADFAPLVDWRPYTCCAPVEHVCAWRSRMRIL